MHSAEIPDVVREATVAIEDRRFYEHQGVDFEGIVRAAIKNARVQEGHPGRLDADHAARAQPLHGRARAQRRRRLQAQDPRGQARPGARGPPSRASRASCGSSTSTSTRCPTAPSAGRPRSASRPPRASSSTSRPRALTLREAALLAGLPQAPSNYNPFLDKGAATARRNDVLQRMADQGYITQAAANKTMAMGLGVKHNRYYTAKREGYVFDYVKQYLIDKYGLDTVRRGGLRVDTTIDLHLQKLARRAMDGNLGAPDRAGAIVTIDPKTGYVRAMASSSRYGDSKFNLAAQGHRQAGSTFKVMVLMDALRRGVDPNRTSYVSRPLHARLAADGAGLRGPHLRPHLRRVDEPRQGDAEVRQHRLRAARRRPRPRVGGPDRARHGHHEPAARLPGRGPGRPDQRRLAAGDGARLRDDRQRRLSREADRGPQGHLPRRPRRRPRQADPPQGLRGRRHLRGDEDPREERAGRHRHQGPDRLPGGGQDRHGRQLHRRLVRRLHAAPGHAPCGSATRRTPIRSAPTRRAARSPRRSGART